ncbi:MAG: peptidoglycan-binding domain-containing protein [Rhodospirillaceae bacterium]
MRLWMIAPLGLALVTAACGETTEQRAASGGLGGAAAGAAVGGPVGAVVGGAAGVAGGMVREDAEQAIAQRSDTQAQTSQQRDRSMSAQRGERVSNQEVRAAQEKLQAMGLYEGEVDGLNGPLTRQAVSRYQEMQGMPQTATLDARTRDSLKQQTATRPQGAQLPQNQQQQEMQQERQEQQRELLQQEQDRQRLLRLQQDPLPPRTVQ